MPERIKRLLRLVDEPNASICVKILEENLELFRAAPGSSHNHQAWPGGYLDHVAETMKIAFELHLSLCLFRRLDFSCSDPILIMFLHDLEKPWRYSGVDLNSKKERREFRDKTIEEYGIVLTEEQKNALLYVEGEHEDYSNLKRAMNPLAAFCHMVDVASARIWFDYPRRN